MDEDYLKDLFAGLGPIRVRRMFGGQGIYCEGVMFALVADGILYLKVDEDNRDRFGAAGGRPFVYQGKGKPVTMSYMTAPEETADDPAAMTPWAEAALAAARRAAAGKPPRRRPAR